MKASVFILLVPVGFATYGGIIYYRLLWLKFQSRQALQHVDEQLNKHHETIPHLLLAMSGYVIHETWVIEHVIQARYRSLAAATQEERMMASSHLSAALHHFFKISESISEIHGDDEAMLMNMQVMMSEQKIAVAREYYNHIVQHYNESIERFPHSLCAQIAGFRRESLFEIPAHSAREFAGLEV
jgi:LemA protein